MKSDIARVQHKRVPISSALGIGSVSAAAEHMGTEAARFSA
jgi:hypothetical protein